MGLSEREQRLLDDMERRLYQSEADVVQTSSASQMQLNLRSLVLGIVVVLVGIGVLIGGVAAQQLWLGIIGFAVMLGGVLLTLSKRDGGAPQFDDEGVQRVVAGAEARESLGDRMNRRWDERMEGER